MTTTTTCPLRTDGMHAWRYDLDIQKGWIAHDNCACGEVRPHEEGTCEDPDMPDRFSDEVDLDICPLHGWQVVTGYRHTRGPDPYGVNRLACRHEVACLGPHEANIILN